MAKVTVNGVEYDLDESGFTNREAMGIESATGVTFGEFGDLLKRGSALALTAMVWTLQKRETPALKFSDVDFKFTELELEDDSEEKADPDEPDSASKA